MSTNITKGNVTKDRLIALAKEMAAVNSDGITVSHLRTEAIRREILTGNEKGRELSYLSSIPRKAGLVSFGERERSPLPCTHGNLQLVWYAAPEAQVPATV